MENDIIIRPYRPEDRGAVREIAYETSVFGSPGTPDFPDREIMEDFLTRYYTDEEPDSLWIAESGGEAVGYVAGSKDTGRYQDIVSYKKLPEAVFSFISRVDIFNVDIFNKDGWGILFAKFLTWLKGGLDRGEIIKKYPAHLHISIKNGFRGKQLGKRLISKFLEYLKSEGVPGVHAVVHHDNLAARKFFESMGFHPEHSPPAVLYDGNSLQTNSMIIYAKEIK
ncbi:MAG: GNAT family N-acetyltransferase [Chloroflexi bacterium]|nr:GNAT family N-acetyltransferase [Chloroflexota bacterium]